MGAWVAYGLGSMNQDLPTFVVLVSRSPAAPAGQPLYVASLGQRHAPLANTQGVALRNAGDPVLYLSNPGGVQHQNSAADARPASRTHHDRIGDPETNARIAQYEMAFRMQTSVPELTDLSDEPKHLADVRPEGARSRGTFAYNCLMARRLAERGVRFTQVFHRGWDPTATCPTT
jgi:hypothetical protein